MAIVRAEVWRSFYQDSVALMRLAESLRALGGVREAAALLGTPANQELLAEAGLATDETRTATPGDLILAVRANSEAAAAAALGQAKELLAQRRQTDTAAGRPPVRTLDAALRLMPDATLAMISVPGAYAALETRRALQRGLHVFLFSDNVPLADEIALKQLARRRGLLCMGPDCGTAYLGGVGLGFANVVKPGRVGCVAASGTGLQAVVAHLAALGEGISHGIGVGGRDLSAEVGGLMTTFALELLARDSATQAVMVISKPPDPAVLPILARAIEEVDKPVIVCCLGAAPAAKSRARWVSTLVDGATATAAALAGRPWSSSTLDPEDARTRLARVDEAGTRRGPGVLGLYTGGTLAYEAKFLLEPLLGTASTRFDGGAAPLRVVDLGDDEFTVGRPHPMIDPEARAARLREAARDPGVGVLLLDVVLGRAAHPDPAGTLAAAVHDARRTAAADGRALAAVASVVGTPDDPQQLTAQIGVLEAAGVEVLPSNADAARFAALVARPELAPSLVGTAR